MPDPVAATVWAILGLPRESGSGNGSGVGLGGVWGWNGFARGNRSEGQSCAGIGVTALGWRVGTQDFASRMVGLVHGLWFVRFGGGDRNDYRLATTKQEAFCN